MEIIGNVLKIFANSNLKATRRLVNQHVEKDPILEWKINENKDRI